MHKSPNMNRSRSNDLWLKFCRACLATGDVKFYELNENIKYFVDLLKIDLDGLATHWLCNNCHIIIKSSLEFAEKVQRAHQTLCGIFDTGKISETDLLKMLNMERGKIQFSGAEVINIAITGSPPPKLEVSEAPIIKSEKYPDEEEHMNSSERDGSTNFEESLSTNVNMVDRSNVDDERYRFSDFKSFAFQTVKTEIEANTMGHASDPEQMDNSGIAHDSSNSVNSAMDNDRPDNELDDDPSFPAFESYEEERLFPDRRVIVINLPKEEQLNAFREHATKEDYISAPYKCELCYKGFHGSLAYNAHMPRHSEASGSYECDMCHQRFRMLRQLKNHSVTHAILYECTLCSYRNVVLRTVMSHFESQHQDQVASGLNSSDRNDIERSCPKTVAERMREYRARKRAEKPIKAKSKTSTERVRDFRARRRQQSASNRYRSSVENQNACAVTGPQSTSQESSDRRGTRVVEIYVGTNDGFHKSLTADTTDGQSVFKQPRSHNEIQVITQQSADDVIRKYDNDNRQSCDIIAAVSTQSATDESRDQRFDKQWLVDSQPKKQTCNVIRINLNREQEIEMFNKQALYKQYVMSTLKCKLCFKGFTSVETYRMHMEKHSKFSGEFECEICHIFMPTARQMEAHRWKHSKMFKCRLCDYTRSDRKTVVCHCRRKHGVDHMNKAVDPTKGQRKRTPAECCHCGMLSASKNSLAVHIRRKHATAVSPALDTPFKCDKCNMQFRFPSHLRYHSVVHSDAKEFYCAECNAWFKTQFALTTHLKTTKVHVSVEAFLQCPLCPVKFVSKQALKHHTETIHVRIQKFKCDKCPKAYCHRNDLNNHVKAVHMERERKHICDLCGKSFLYKRSLVSHMNVHTGDRPHKCPSCTATFRYPAALYTHNRLRHLKIKKEYDQKKKKPEKCN